MILYLKIKFEYSKLSLYNEFKMKIFKIINSNNRKYISYLILSINYIYL